MAGNTTTRRRAAWRLVSLPPVAVLSLAVAVRGQKPALPSQSIVDVKRGFATPPDDARPMMRWWWFGPAVEKPELQREILAMKAGGIGGFEIQPVYPLALDDPSRHTRNLPYLSPEFLDAVKFAATTARDNGLRVDMTLASGWPYGGPHVTADHAASRLRVETVNVAAGAASVPVPSMANGESLIAAFVTEGTDKQFDPDKMARVTGDVTAGRMALTAQPSPRVVQFFLASRTGQQVKRAALNAEGFVLDHLNRTAIDEHLSVVADKLMTAFGDTPPFAVFSDSLEVYGTDWTGDMLEEFQRRRHYDLLPHLPQLVSGNSSSSAALRHDWGLTITELVNERYLTPIDDWAKAHHTRFRSQTYGVPAVTLSSNRLVALPEGEGPQWDQFSFTRWATSASHLYGRPVTSAETWTWLHSPAFRATPLDMKAEADRFFLEGVNQLIGHGWPYTPLTAEEPGWAFYAAAVFNDHNPWWGVMPDVTKYLQRVSYLLRQGQPANDIAVLLPDDDAYAEFSLGKASVSESMKKYVTPALMRSLLAAGYNVDFIDAEAVQNVGVPYPALVLPHVERLSPETLKLVAAYVARGGYVLAVGSVPSVAPGFLRAEEISKEVIARSASLLSSGGHALQVPRDQDVGTALRQVIAPDMKLAAGVEGIGFLHRRLADADVYFVANTTNTAVETTAEFRSKKSFRSWWDPFSGSSRNVTGGGSLALTLAPYESRILVLSDSALGGSEAAASAEGKMIGDLTRGWKVSFPGLGKNSEALAEFDAPTSWTDDARTHFYSGQAVYTKTFMLDAESQKSGRRLVLDFGEGKPVAVDPRIKSGMRALLEGPVREAAVVYVNGVRIGSIWHPPYALDLTGALHAGDNTIELRVANTAINGLAGRAPADYRLLWDRYGQRFVPQDMDHLEPLPSGILGPVHLLEMD